MTKPSFAKLRKSMVREQLVRRGIRDPRVLEVMGRIERHLFVPEQHLENAYADHPIPIGVGQTLSQPYIVALMTEALGLEGAERVLEVGTGSGYQTAVLAALAGEIFTIERDAALSATATVRLADLGITNVHLRTGDGRLGWPEEAPFAAILVGAAPRQVPPKLLDQLGAGGRLIIPVGEPQEQELELHEKDEHVAGGWRLQRLGAVRFVPFA